LIVAAESVFQLPTRVVVPFIPMTDALEWHKANLKRCQDQLAVLEAACESPEAASRNGLVTELRKKIDPIEKMLAAKDSVGLNSTNNARIP
jgi:hypothetical protein